MKTARRIQDVKEYYFAKKLREIRERRRAGEDIINLGIGSPDLTPPDSVKDSMSESLDQDGSFSYKPYLGIPELRQAMAQFYGGVYGVRLNPDEFVPLIGSKEGIAFISLAYLDPGDEVLVPNPGYPAYEAAARLAGGKIVRFNLLPELQWHPDPDVIADLITPRTRMIWLNYPNMPTGAPANPEIIERVIKLAGKHDILVCHDNPYSTILSDNPFSILSLGNSVSNTIELNSLSKSFNMAGARVGMLCGSRELIDPVFRVQSNFSSGMFEPIQRAAVEALNLHKTDWFEQLNNIYAQRRNIVCDFLDKLGCKYDRNTAGMFVWATIPTKYKSGEELSEALLNTAHVFIAPGHIFGSNGERCIRVSLCASHDLLVKAEHRITHFVNSNNHDSNLKHDQ